MSQQTLQDFILGLHLPQSAYTTIPIGTPSTAPYEFIHSSGSQRPAFLRCDTALQNSMLANLRQQLSNMATASEPVPPLPKMEYEVILMRLRSQPHELGPETTTSALFDTLLNPVKGIIDALLKQTVKNQDADNTYNQKPDGIISVTSGSNTHQRVHVEHKSWRTFVRFTSRILSLDDVTMETNETGHRAIFFKVVRSA